MSVIRIYGNVLLNLSKCVRVMQAHTLVGDKPKAQLQFYMDGKDFPTYIWFDSAKHASEEMEIVRKILTEHYTVPITGTPASKAGF
jgi:hypothetical protein